MGKTVAIILARGGSKGIKNKNIVPFCGKPLILWTIEQLQESKAVDAIWVSSDSPKILRVAKTAGCDCIKRPKHFADDIATSESAWIHALSQIPYDVDIVVAAQATSPIREPKDFSGAVKAFKDSGADSMFSVSSARDLCLWAIKDNNWECYSYDPTNPNRRRQDFEERFIENGSFYLFTPEALLENGVRFGSNINAWLMQPWKSFEIDEPSDLVVCEAVMKAFLEGRFR